MMLNKKSIFIFVTIGLMLSLAAAPLLVYSRMTFYSFEIIMPAEVDVDPGQDVTIDGGILVTGFYWLHNFDLKVEGMPYEYEIEPKGRWEHVRILRDWNPEQGMFRVPDKFKLHINIPEDATGSHIVTVTGQEHHSFREVSNFTYFVLRVAGEPIKPQLTVTDILVPEEIKEFEPFQLTFKINNEGPMDTDATVTIVVPEDWEVDEASQNLSIKKNESAASAFDIIPTTAAGEVSLVVQYPFREEIIRFTKTGPYLIPAGAVTTTLPVEEERPPSLFSQLIGYASSLLDRVTGGLEEIESPYARSVIIGIIFVLLLIIIWLVLDLVRFARREKKEPEKMKTTKISEPDVGDFEVRVTDVENLV